MATEAVPATRVSARIPMSTALPLPQFEPKSGIARWMTAGESAEEHEPRHGTYPWWKVIWLTGVDYFSTLGYQPGIALLAVGAIAPIATGLLVLVTLFGAVPVYQQVARRSFAGQGSLAMLETLLPGWKGKLLLLVLLGFAATDFVITMTLSAADAAKHAIENPYLHPYLGDAQMLLTLGLLALLAAVFLAGFEEAIGLATLVGVPYILLNVVVLGRALVEIAHHPEVFPGWRAALEAKGDWTTVALLAAIGFPKLALGLSGFETGVSVMPLVDGGEKDERRRRGGAHVPVGRIRNTHRLLLTAALIMSVLLVASSFATTLLIQPQDYRIGGKASGRAIAFLAHQFFGSSFGTLYDVSTILILWFAGASAMAGLLHLIPRYLPRFGMAPMWTVFRRPLVLVLFTICVVVTLVFRANVEAQSGAYATGVLVLILSAAVAAALALKREGKRGMSLYCAGAAAIFAFALVDNVVERPDGVIIGSCFILLVLTVSAVSRGLRATELRIPGGFFVDETSRRLASAVAGKKVHLVPLKTNSPAARAKKRAEIRKYYRVDGPVAFLHVNLIDNRSEFLSPIDLEIREEHGDYVIEVFGAIAIANTIAYVSELLDPVSLFLGLTRENLVEQAARFLFLGEGETGLMVYAILLRYWEWTPEDDVRPLIFLMSD
jgi:hypothetical protein